MGTTSPKSTFWNNFSDLIDGLNIDDSALSMTKIKDPKLFVRDEEGGVQKRTVSNFCQSGTASKRTKKILIAIVNHLAPSLPRPVSLLDLENPTFSVRYFLERDGEDSRSKFDIDYMIREIKRIVESTPAVKMPAELVMLASESAKEIFRKEVYSVASSLGLGQAIFSGLVIEVGMPPELPLKSPDSTLAYAKRMIKNPDRLSEGQRVIWKVATTIYRPFEDETFSTFRSAQRMLAMHWDKSIRYARNRRKMNIVSALGTLRPQEAHQVFLLSWLELSLVTQAPGSELGKTGLFELGLWHQKRLLHNPSK